MVTLFFTDTFFFFCTAQKRKARQKMFPTRLHMSPGPEKKQCSWEAALHRVRRCWPWPVRLEDRRRAFWESLNPHCVNPLLSHGGRLHSITSTRGLLACGIVCSPQERACSYATLGTVDHSDHLAEGCGRGSAGASWDHGPKTCGVIITDLPECECRLQSVFAENPVHFLSTLLGR